MQTRPNSQSQPYSMADLCYQLLGNDLIAYILTHQKPLLTYYTAKEFNLLADVPENSYQNYLTRSVLLFVSMKFIRLSIM